MGSSSFTNKITKVRQFPRKMVNIKRSVFRAAAVHKLIIRDVMCLLLDFFVSPSIDVCLSGISSVWLQRDWHWCKSTRLVRQSDEMLAFLLPSSSSSFFFFYSFLCYFFPSCHTPDSKKSRIKNMIVSVFYAYVTKLSDFDGHISPSGFMATLSFGSLWIYATIETFSCARPMKNP